jgi:hypothetical protein
MLLQGQLLRELALKQELELALACARRAPLVLALELAAPASQARGPDLALEQEQGLEQEHAVEQALALERPE